MSLSVVVPVLNESGNVSHLYESLERELSQDFELVFIDGGSSDGTVEELKALESHCEEVRALVKEDLDLAQSVLTGFKHATSRRAVVMDGDLQHPVPKVEELAGKLEDSNLAIGTRHAENGSIEEWSPKRKFISWFGRTYSRIWIREARSVSDPMSGFFAVNLDALNLDRLEPSGFKVLLEVISDVETDIEEVGYTFQGRLNGSSSLNWKEALNFLNYVPHLKIRKNRYWD